MWRTVIVLIVLLFTVQTSPALTADVVSTPEGAVGIVTFVKGSVTVLRNGNQQPLAVDDVVYRTDVIVTAERSKARLILYGEGLEGTRVVGPSQHFEISSASGRSHRCTSWTEAAVNMIKSFMSEDPESEAVLAVRDYRKVFLILFPWGEAFRRYPRVILVPVAGATSYRVTVTWETDDDVEQVTVTGESNIIDIKDKRLAAFSAERYNLAAQALRDSEVLEEETGISVTPLSNEKLEKVQAQLAAIASDFSPVKDPTELLLRGNFFLDNGFYSDAAVEYIRYSRFVGKSRLARIALRKALLSMNAGKNADMIIERVLGP